jgi:hypothetical protein
MKHRTLKVVAILVAAVISVVGIGSAPAMADTQHAVPTLINGRGTVRSTATAAPTCVLSGTSGVAGAGGSRVDVFDSSAQILPATDQHGASTATVCAARNSTADFQIQVSASAGASLSSVSMTASTLTSAAGAAIPAADVHLYREAYATLSTMSDDELSDVIPRNATTGACTANCRFPDALIPDTDQIVGQKRNAFPFAVPQAQNGAVWADISVPQAQPAATYTGTISITVPGAPTVVPVTLTVENVTLPSTSTTHSTFDISTSSAGGMAGYAQYAELGLLDRINVVPDNGFTNDATATTYLTPLLTGTDPVVNKTLPGASLTDLQVTSTWNASTTAALKTYLSGLGQTSKAAAYCDEISADACVAQYLAGPAKGWSGLPLNATITPGVSADPNTAVVPAADAAYITGVVPLINYIHVNPKLPAWGSTGNRMPALAAWRAAKSGRQVWTYSTCVSAACDGSYVPQWFPLSSFDGWPTYGIDQVASEQQAMGWLMYSYGIDGEHYYETLRQPNLAGNPAEEGQNGDGTLFYSYDKTLVGGTTPIPIESLRLKRIRDGRQDNELLKLAAANGTDAMTLAKQTFPTIGQSGIPGSTLDAARATLLGWFTPAQTTPPVQSSKYAPHDLDCNGYNDFLAVQNGKLLYYPRVAANTAVGSDWAPNAPIAEGTGYGIYTKLLMPGDLNGDGKPDVVGVESDGSLWLLAGNCTGALAPAVPMGVKVTNAVIAGDFNGDGIADLFDQRADGTLWLLGGTGTGTFKAPTQVGAGWQSFTITGVGDTDGDNAPDVFARTASGTSYIYLSTGTGGWRTITGGNLQQGLKLPLSSDVQVIGAGSLNDEPQPALEAITSTGDMISYSWDGIAGFTPTGATAIGHGWNNLNLVAS